MKGRRLLLYGSRMMNRIQIDHVISLDWSYRVISLNELDSMPKIISKLTFDANSCNEEVLTEVVVNDYLYLKSIVIEENALTNVRSFNLTRLPILQSVIVEEEALTKVISYVIRLIRNILIILE